MEEDEHQGGRVEEEGEPRKREREREGGREEGRAGGRETRIDRLE